jgi:hypothetical protein
MSSTTETSVRTALSALRPQSKAGALSGGHLKVDAEAGDRFADMVVSRGSDVGSSELISKAGCIN